MCAGCIGLGINMAAEQSLSWLFGLSVVLFIYWLDLRLK